MSNAEWLPNNTDEVERVSLVQCGLTVLRRVRNSGGQRRDRALVRGGQLVLLTCEGSAGGRSLYKKWRF